MSFWNLGLWPYLEIGPMKIYQSRTCSQAMWKQRPERRMPCEAKKTETGAMHLQAQECQELPATIRNEE